MGKNTEENENGGEYLVKWVKWQHYNDIMGKASENTDNEMRTVADSICDTR